MSDRLIQLRASSAPLAFRCPGSVRPSPVPVKEPFYEADLGSAAHEACRPLAEGQGIDWGKLHEIAARWGVDEEELRVLCALAYALWVLIRPEFPEAVTEVAMQAEVGDVTLTGHIDWLSILSRERVARFGDWKFGRRDYGYQHQIMSYATLILLDGPHLTDAFGLVGWVRDRDVERYRVNRDAAKAWVERLHREVVDWDGTYRPGPHCTFCPRSIPEACPAAHALARRDIAIIRDLDASPGNLLTMKPEQVVYAYRMARMYAQASKRVLDMIKSHVERNGTVEAGAEGRLLITSKSNRRLDPIAGKPFLLDAGLTEREIAEVTEISISQAEKLIATKAGKGNGAAAIRTLKAKLETADDATRALKAEHGSKADVLTLSDSFELTERR